MDRFERRSPDERRGAPSGRQAFGDSWIFAEFTASASTLYRRKIASSVPVADRPESGLTPGCPWFRVPARLHSAAESMECPPSAARFTAAFESSPDTGRVRRMVSVPQADWLDASSSSSRGKVRGAPFGSGPLQCKPCATFLRNFQGCPQLFRQSLQDLYPVLSKNSNCLKTKGETADVENCGRERC